MHLVVIFDELSTPIHFFANVLFTLYLFYIYFMPILNAFRPPPSTGRNVPSNCCYLLIRQNDVKTRETKMRILRSQENRVELGYNERGFNDIFSTTLYILGVSTSSP